MLELSYLVTRLELQARTIEECLRLLAETVDSCPEPDDKASRAHIVALMSYIEKLACEMEQDVSDQLLSMGEEPANEPV